MTFQVLISTMNQTNYILLDEMNIASDAVVINQCDKNNVEEFEYRNYHIKWVNTTDRGVGKSRNLAFMNANADIILFADDDVIYNDEYKKKIIEEFQNTHADLITFNLKSLNDKRPEAITKKTHKLNCFNCLRYGAFRIAVRRNVILKKNIFYSLLFGGGAVYQAGEDNLYITDCIKKHCRSIASQVHIGVVKQNESTWFRGYDEKYYYDRGALFCAMYGFFASPMLFLIEVKNNATSKIKLLKRYSNGLRGVRDYKSTTEDYECSK